ncbi:hypothetical protein MGYG_01191 [Nannizzia gypsea CBS 118893]|uniref:DUF7820 domain-containing protein n=1 Tax=Arthroderma gypseum (strain ATCC MYA-4604 / CBS 118893) TaxID=535722 RepID=E5QZD7_ARTGP|nr:hypothetical protein MGYG_01191 [Nannizzia gypsea CBS 118893]EFQ98155.1 hypothetical protein MGYG_01191 [Nannizzia gypsea CBS 118893]
MSERPTSPSRGSESDVGRRQSSSIELPGGSAGSAGSAGAGAGGGRGDGSEQSSSQSSPVLNVFSDAFSVERLDTTSSNSQRQSVNSLSSHSSSSSDKTETGDAQDQGPILPLPTSPFQGIPESLERRASLLLQQQQQQQQQYHQQYQQHQQTVLPQIPDKKHFLPDAGPVPRTASPAVSIAQSTASAGHRSVSTVSRLSIPPRALSPYTGQTGPSHPYAMYSQGISVNRTSSISSNSTVRVPERNFVAAAPPQHPYALYSQNTVPEHVPDEPLNTTVPLPLPGHPQVYSQPATAPVADEVGDILGTDGYREQLPPYSRYPDGIPVKSYYAPTTPIGAAGATTNNSSQPLETPVSPVSQVSSRTFLTENNPAAAAPAADSSAVESGNTSQEKVNEKKMRRNQKICCGLPLWIIGLIGVGLITGTLIGGVLGGIVGARQGKKDSDKTTPDPDHRPTPSLPPTPTASGILDAIPIPTGSGAPTFPPIPTGPISISGRTFNSLSQSCVNTTSLRLSWDCVDYGHFKGSISSGPNNTRTIRFPQTSITGKFIYGDQVPALGGRDFKLEPAYDMTSPEDGPAYFFYTTFDKLVIVPKDEFPSGVVGKSVEKSALFKRSGNRSGKVQSQPGDKPWFCWWNTTYIEAFIYATKNATEDDMKTSGDGPDDGIFSMPPTGFPRASTVTSSALPTATPTTMSGEGSEDLPQAYPQAMKIKELRYSDASPSPPYCQQMQVLDDGNLSMLESQVIIEEKDSSSSPDNDDVGIGSKMARRSALIGPRDAATDQCYCEWLYGN